VLNIENRRNSARWSLQLGATLMVLGIVALTTIRVTATAQVAAVGWVVVVSGLLEAVHAFEVRSSSAFYLHLVPAITAVPIGLLIATHSGAGAMAWMLLFAAVFTIIGLFRVLAAFRMKFPAWPWAVFDGVATLALGSVLWAAWPWLGLWFFGFAVGISLVMRGWSSIMFARHVRKASAEHAPKQVRMSAGPSRVEAKDAS